NPYSKKCLDIIRNNPNALILDFGAGNPKKEEVFDNVIRIDFVHYSNIHVVSNKKNIPFQENTFDFILSESVFEHVRDPWHYASELYRILKKGGKILIDTAFLFPVHGAPYNYYNMTLYGVEETFKMFRKIESGVEWYQSASVTMNILRNYYLALFENDAIRQEVASLLGTVDFTRYDQYVPKEKQHIMSAGVYFIGEK
ncbi:methyltransferase domain-containing protein, partial [candidate division KSB1 bacterium]|nr:methyltransferase domain-containing protein [candidate division KSB1 bacterium]